MLRLAFKIQTIKKSGKLYGLPFVLTLYQQRLQTIKALKDVLKSHNTTIFKEYFNFINEKESYLHN
jgi:hypothetical protein